LFGRDAEVAGVVRLLDSERLVTLVGPGGVGKTTIALEAARRDRGGEVTIVKLAAVTEASSLVAALTTALGLRSSTGDPLMAIGEVLVTRPWLLVLDTCEHLLNSVRGVVSALLSSAPQLTVLATSRERLGLPVEQICRVAPLPVPALGLDGDPAMIPLVALFIERAVASDPTSHSSPIRLSRLLPWCAAWTDCLSPSSWPPGGCRRSGSPIWAVVSIAPWTCCRE
jgi:predicted ATPase